MRKLETLMTVILRTVIAVSNQASPTAVASVQPNTASAWV